MECCASKCRTDVCPKCKEFQKIIRLPVDGLSQDEQKKLKYLSHHRKLKDERRKDFTSDINDWVKKYPTKSGKRIGKRGVMIIDFKENLSLYLSKEQTGNNCIEK